MPKQTNLPPTGVLLSDKYELTLPDNTVTLDATLSSDPNRRGRVDRVKFWGESATITPTDIIYPNEYKAKATLPGEGVHKLNLQCWDKAGNASEVVSIYITVKEEVKTLFGAKISHDTFAVQDAALKALGVIVVRPPGITLSSYNNTERRLDEFLQAGYICIVNVSWDFTTLGEIVPFYKDLVNYATKLDKLLSDYKAWIDTGVLHFCIENEENNERYFGNAPIEDYIALLNTAVEVCRKYDAPVSDGGLFIEYLTMDMTGQYLSRHESQVEKTKKLIAAFGNIDYDNFYVNVHTAGVGSAYDRGDIPGAVEHLRKLTGHEVISNEWHVEEAKYGLVTGMVTLWKKAKVLYSLIWDESRDQGGAIEENGRLTALGTEFAEAIK
jgi:hypothetical protein